jgi:DNA-directed RNA polymerase subunit RPC12/RpoP
MWGVACLLLKPILVVPALLIAGDAKTRCPRCGERVFVDATQCPHCSLSLDELFNE